VTRYATLAAALAGLIAAGCDPGVKVVFSSDRHGNEEIYIMSADGTGQTNVTHHPADDDHPAFSPDGMTIVFRSDRDDGNDEIYIMAADGSGQTNLTQNPAVDRFPSFRGSP